jgi:hypothetical protein
MYRSGWGAEVSCGSGSWCGCVMLGEAGRDGGGGIHVLWVSRVGDTGLHCCDRSTMDVSIYKSGWGAEVSWGSGSWCGMKGGVGWDRGGGDKGGAHVWWVSAVGDTGLQPNACCDRSTNGCVDSCVRKEAVVVEVQVRLGGRGELGLRLLV